MIQFVLFFNVFHILIFFLEITHPLHFPSETDSFPDKNIFKNETGRIAIDWTEEKKINYGNIS